MSFFNSKSKQTYTLSISLKSSSIDFQLINATNPNRREVLFFEQHIILLDNSQDPTLYTHQYTKELGLLFARNNTKIKQITKNKTLNIHFVLHAPWFTSKIVSIRHDEAVVVNEGFLQKKLAEIHGGENLHNLEKRIIKIQTNGYTLNELTNVKTSNIHLTAYSSYISKKIYTLLMDVLKKYLPSHKNISYATSPLLIFENIKRFLIKEDNVTFLYIDSEITQIGVIEDDSLTYFATFPIGKHDFLREIRSNVKTYDYDLLYQKEIQIKSKKQEAQFELVKKNWSQAIIQSLELLNRNVPSKILIITDTKTKDFFTNLLLTSVKEGSQTILKNNRIINFDISLLKDIITYKTPIGDNELDLKLEALI